MNAIVDRFSRSWELFKCSLRVMRDHPKLLVFPALINLFTFAILLFFLIPVLVAAVVPHIAAALAGSSTPHQYALHLPIPPWLSTSIAALSGPAAVLLSGGFYLFSMVVATFCNVAFNSEILQALNGEPVSIRHGVRVAWSRIKAILLWSLLAGLVGLFIRWLEEKFSLIGRLIAGLIGVTWSVASIFVIPILIRDTSTSNPIEILSRSARTIKATWGEALVGYAGLKGMDGVVFWASFFYAIGAVALAIFISPWTLVATGALWLLALFAYIYVAGIASKAYLCALYIYASEGVVPSHYDASMMDTAWRLKKA